MSAALETEIGRLLEQYGDAGLVADELLKRWERNLFSPEEQFCIAQFLLLGGFVPTLLEQILRLLSDRRRLPWAQFAEALDQIPETVTEDVAAAFLEGAETQVALDELLRSHRVDKWSRAFRRKRETLKARFDLELADRKEQLRERLAFFRSQRVVDEEANILKELQAIFPNDREFEREEMAWQERWAREVIAQSTSVTDVTREMAERADRLTQEQVTFKQQLIAMVRTLAEKDPSVASDLALLLYFMEFYADAYEILKLNPKSAAADWFGLELLLRSRQYLVVLDEANRLEIEYAGDPDSTFAVIYARARALWGLGQASMAIDLLRSIVNIRPYYKAAHSLLMEWTGGEL